MIGTVSPTSSYLVILLLSPECVGWHAVGDMERAPQFLGGISEGRVFMKFPLTPCSGMASVTFHRPWQRRVVSWTVLLPLHGMETFMTWFEKGNPRLGPTEQPSG